jgi:phage gpG-like protein
MANIANLQVQIPKILRESLQDEIAEGLNTSVMSYMGGSGQLQIRSGRLARSLMMGDSENIFEIKENGDEIIINFGTKVPYGAVHEYGGMAGRNRSSNIPARPYLNPGFERFNEKVLPKIIDKAVEKIIKELDGDK